MPMTPRQPGDDRETLSALFDGELHGDAARFAVRRLDHDSAWRQTVGNWQLAGDILRGQVEAPAPAGFAQRVSAALEAEARMDTVPAIAQGVHGPRRPLRSWMPGAALAASVAVAAFFVARPLDGPGGQVETSPPAVAAVPAQAESRTPRATDTDADTSAGAAPAAALAGAALAAAERPRRATQRQVAAASPSRDTTPVPSAVAPVDPAPAEGSRDIAQVAATDPAAEPRADPFEPRAAEFGARPWPRATLSDYRASGALTASYGASGTASAPSFYPFVPRTDEGGNVEVPVPADNAAGDGTPPAPNPPSP